MRNKEVTDISGMMWPIRVTGSLLMLMSHMCVDITLQPLASETFRGHIVQHLLMMGVPSITKIWVAPKSAMALFGLSLKMAPQRPGPEKKWRYCGKNEC
jgi:hypothetical protein